MLSRDLGMRIWAESEEESKRRKKNEQKKHQSSGKKKISKNKQKRERRKYARETGIQAGIVCWPIVHRHGAPHNFI
jgi:hypothetical protein